MKLKFIKIVMSLILFKLIQLDKYQKKLILSKNAIKTIKNKVKAFYIQFYLTFRLILITKHNKIFNHLQNHAKNRYKNKNY